MGAAEGAFPRHGARLMDADANMNCTKRRPEEARSDVVAAAAAAAETPKEGEDTGRTRDYVATWRWPDLAVQLFIHVGCLYGFYLILTSVRLLTTIWGKSPFVTRCFAVRAVHQSSFGVRGGVGGVVNMAVE